MKKIILMLVILCVVLCGCQSENEDIRSSSVVSVESGGGEVEQIKQYQGKTDYEKVYTGHATFVQNENTYFYTDEFGFHSLDKQGQTPKLIADYAVMTMSRNKDTLYDDIPFMDKIFLYDMNSGNISYKEYLNLFPIEAQDRQSYSISFTLINDGWLVRTSSDHNTIHRVYKTDFDFTTKKQLPLEEFDLILDDEVFYLGAGGNILCYNLTSQKHHYVTNQFTVSEEDIQKTSRCIEYLGKGKIMIYAENKLHIINLTDGSTFKTIDYPIENFEFPHPSVTYNDEKIYLQLWEGEEDYRIEEISYSDGSSSVIYRGKNVLPYVYSELADADEQYIYVCNLGYYDEEGNPTTHIAQMKNDGTDSKIIIRETLPEDYLQ